ncbi:MAG: hypothetical protein ABL997_02860 [Planctomycetota bacterium]
MLRATLVLVTFAAASIAQVSMTHLGTVDVASTSIATNPQFIGTNPSAMAWNGTDLWVAGFNNQALAGPAGIAKCSTALTAPTFGTAFGVGLLTPGSRGYSGLDVDGTHLVAAYDVGASDPNGITAWDLNGNFLWAKAARAGSGVGIDPGFVTIVDPGTGWTTFGSGRRVLQDNVTGADIYTTATGMIIQVTGETNTFWRDMTFDPLLGDIWLRRSNDVVAADRVGGNLVANARVVVDAPAADSVNQQNIAFCRTGAENVVFWNLRSGGANGQLWTNVLQCNRASDGAAMTIDWRGFTSVNGSGAYDFSFDEGTNTLAISDFSNKVVHVFAVSTFKEYGTSCLGAGNFPLLLDGTGDLRAAGQLTYTLSQAAGLSIGGFAFGATQDFTPLPFPGGCFVHVAPLLFTEGVFFTGVFGPGSGLGSLTFTVPPGLSNQGLTAQGFCLENGDLAQIKTSNGIEVLFP